MTLMIFNIKVTEIPNELVRSQLVHEVFILWPKFLVYIISFVMLGVYWVGHHDQYHYILRTDRVFLWINIFFLMCVSLIPFSMGLLGQYPAERTALVVYGLNSDHGWWISLRSLVVRDAGSPPGCGRYPFRSCQAGEAPYPGGAARFAGGNLHFDFQHSAEPGALRPDSFLIHDSRAD